MANEKQILFFAYRFCDEDTKIAPRVWCWLQFSVEALSLRVSVLENLIIPTISLYAI